MKLAAIDIGTNSIHMIIVDATSKNQFEVLMQEKEMVKLGAGVFANNRLSQKAFKNGIATIKRYVHLADQYGVEHIITSATSATREAKNGREFLDQVIAEAGLSPQLISGKEEARLIFLAVRKNIELNGEKALVLDIGGGSTEAVVGNHQKIFFGNSMRLGVLRLLDWVGYDGPLEEKAQDDIRKYIRKKAEKIMSEANSHGFSKIIGTSGTIRSLGEACLSKGDNPNPGDVNAEVIKTKDLEKLVSKLLQTDPDKRSAIPGINSNRVEAIHLGGLLLVELLHMAGAEEIMLSDSSLREGMIIDYIEKNAIHLREEAVGHSVRERSSLLLAKRYEVNLDEKIHVSRLALQLYDQLKDLHHGEENLRDLLQQACLIYDVGLFIKFQDYHKHSRYIITKSGLRGFNNEETLLLGHMARYHRKSGPSKKQKKFKRLSKSQRKTLLLLAGILRIAVGLDKTKNQWVQHVHCLPENDLLTIRIFGEESMPLEIWEAQRYSDTLSQYLKMKIKILEG